MRKLRKLIIESSPFISALFGLVGMGTGILGAFSYNIETIVASALLVVQSMSFMVYGMVTDYLWESHTKEVTRTKRRKSA